MASYGPNAPTAAVSTGGLAHAWANPTNCFSTNGVYTTCTNPQGFATNDLLDVSGFGFAIPAVTILGITATITRFYQGGTTGAPADDLIRLMKTAGVSVGNNYFSGVDWTGTLGPFNYGGSADLWGTTWTPAEVNAASFGIRIRVYGNGGNDRNASIDSVTITIETTGGTFSSRLALLGVG